jgi:hypothetical protein
LLRSNAGARDFCDRFSLALKQGTGRIMKSFFNGFLKGTLVAIAAFPLALVLQIFAGRIGFKRFPGPIIAVIIMWLAVRKTVWWTTKKYF